MFSCSTYGSSTQSTRSNDAVAKFASREYKVGHLEALLACGPRHKSKRIYILSKCPCSV